MRYVVLDTDVASRAIKGKLADPMAARVTGMAWCVTFVTVGEPWQWATTRSWEPRTREELELWLGRVVVLNSDDATSRTWGQDLGGGQEPGRWSVAIEDADRPFSCAVTADHHVLCGCWRIAAGHGPGGRLLPRAGATAADWCYAAYPNCRLSSAHIACGKISMPSACVLRRCCTRASCHAG